MERPNSVSARRRIQSRDGWDVEATGLVARGGSKALRFVAGVLFPGVGRAGRRFGFGVCAAPGLLATCFFAARRVGFGATAARTTWLDGWTTTAARSSACVEVLGSSLVPVRAARVFLGTESAAGTEGVGAGSAGGGELGPLGGC
jgi:hypothetical protein